MKRILLLSFLLSTFLSTGLMAQERTVTGQVTSANDGSGLPGVNVILKGTTTGTVTDIDGNYKINVSDENSVLVFSFIGLITQEIEVGSRSTLDVSMADDVTQLSEVVVTALGIEREARSIGYGIDVVDGEELVKARESNILNSLQGKVTGVNITNTGGNLGSSSKITIRGVTSLSGSNAPLWIVDGVPINDRQTATGSRITGNRDFSNGAAVINPDDVESMNVLKGAAATALYGSRAAAGAIIVTTKKGKSGKGGKPSITLNSTVRFDKLFRIPDYQGDYAMGSLGKYDSSSLGFDWGPRNVGQTVNYLPISGETGPLYKVEDNGINDFFETGTTLINNFAVAQSDEKSDYRLSVTALNQTGILPGSELDRYTISLNAGVKHSKWLRSRFGASYITTNSIGTGATGANDPNVISVPSTFSSNADQNLFRPWIDDAGNQINQIEATQNNPYWLRHENHNDRDDDRFLGNMEMTFTPIDKLNLTARVGYDYDNDYRFFSNRKGTAQRIEGTFETDDIRRTQFNVDIIGSYQTDITEDISITGLLGWNFNDRVFRREGIEGVNLIIPELFDPGNVESAVAARDFSRHKLYGVYGSVDLSYKNWATLSLTGRNDWSSTLPLDNNSYFYPSASLAVVFTDAFGISNNILSYGKFRASWAQVGNDTNPYELDFLFTPVSVATGQYSLNLNFPFDGRLAFRGPNEVPPQGLLPEQQTSYEFGVELGFFDGKIGLDVSYFKTENIDQIIGAAIPETTGFATARINAGQIDTEGLEISLDATPVSLGDFQWNTLVNFSHAESTVIELNEGVERLIIASAFNSVQVIAEPGKEYQLFAVPYLRDSVSGRPIIDPNTGLRQPGTSRTFGSVLPDFTMGFVNNLSWKGLNLSFTIDWRSGGLMKSSSVENLQDFGLVAETAVNREGTFIDSNGVLDNGDGTFRDNDVPVRNAQHFWRGLSGSSMAESAIFDASFVKLREVAVSYTLPSNIFENNFIESLTVGVEGRNLALLYSEVPHIDPESNLFGSGADGFGIERNSIPSTRSVGFNVRLTF